MFTLTLEHTHLPWQPAPSIPSRAPQDAFVPVVHFFQGSANQVELGPDDFLSQDQPTAETVVFSRCLRQEFSDLAVSVTQKSVNGEILSHIFIKIPPGVRLTRVQFPIIICPDVQPVDHLLTAYTWGDDITDPIYQIPRYCSRTRSHSPLTFIDHGDNEIIYVYPAAMSMQYMTLYNLNRSTYLARYSTGDETASFNAKIIEGNNLALSINHYPFLSGTEWHSPECSQANLAGGWQAAADRYASHMQEKMPQAYHSPWLKSFNGWIEVGMHFEGKAPEYRYSDLPDVFRAVQKDGINTMHVYGWSGNGHDTLYPDYDINPALGTAADLRRAFDQIKTWGGRGMLYTNSRLVDPSSKYYQNGGSAWICRQRDGSPYLEKYATEAKFAVTCPACKGFRDYFVKQVQRMVGEYGAHAIQMDQINTTISFMCFDPNHQHEHSTPSNNFLPGWTELARQVEAAGLALNPDFFMWGEGCHERFGRHVAVHQGHGEARTVTVGEMIPELFKYHYPDAIVTGIANSLDQLARVAAQGKPMDIWRIEFLTPDSRQLLKDYLNLRKRLPEYYFEGRFTAGAELLTAGSVKAYGQLKRDGDLLVSLWAPGALLNQPVNAWLKNPRPNATVVTHYPNQFTFVAGEWLHLTWEGPLAVVEFQ